MRLNQTHAYLAQTQFWRMTVRDCNPSSQFWYLHWEIIRAIDRAFYSGLMRELTVSRLEGATVLGGTNGSATSDSQFSAGLNWVLKISCHRTIILPWTVAPSLLLTANFRSKSPRKSPIQRDSFSKRRGVSRVYLISFLLPDSTKSQM